MAPDRERHNVQALTQYFELVQRALVELSSAVPGGQAFDPGPQLPKLDDQFRAFLAPARVEVSDGFASYKSTKLSLMNLATHPATQTTKTMASSIIVARAIEYIQRTDTPITIVTPSSANKAVALRDAVSRAIELELVAPESLNIVVVVPRQGAFKMRDSPLSQGHKARQANPVCVLDSSRPEDVKTLAADAARASASYIEKLGRRLWYTLSLDNYLAGDVVRAAVESDALPINSGRRVHAHAVSSAYGLLGHDFGRELLQSRGVAPSYLLIQHLGAPDMVDSLCKTLGNAYPQPAYELSHENGCFVQDSNPHYPGVTFDPAEVLEPTFYSRNPQTSARMNAIIKRQGGSGIIVSSAECIERYGQVRELMAQAQILLPGNPFEIREWSLIMALTGALNALDRNLIGADEMVVHNSGFYTRSDYNPMGASDFLPVSLADDVVEAVHSSVQVRSA